MPRSQRPRRRYQGPKNQRDFDQMMSSRAPLHLDPNPPAASAPPRPPAAPAPAKSHLRPGNRRGLLIAAGVGGAAAVTGGGLYLSRHRRKSVSKLYNPITDEYVEFGKAGTYNVTSGTNVRSVSPLVPTGGHVSHENALLVRRHKRKHKGSQTALEQYRSGSSTQMRGGGKAYGDKARHVGKRLSSQQGAAVLATRGRPMADLARHGRHGVNLARI